ncbi:hypothetical protein JXA32_11365 [Candidatus Sumerlaeota bacterium]|nr:hypothetical protein [Candidatus Sumerlaeota bacterium]
MTYNIVTFDREHYIQLKFFGDWPEGAGDEIISDLFGAIVASGHKRAMLDFREAGEMDSSP